MNQTTHKQAQEEYIGEQYIEWLMNEISIQVETWPIILKFRQILGKPEKIKKLALQVFLAQEAFLGSREGDPGFLRFAIGNLSESDDPLAESALEILDHRRVEELAGHQVEKGILKTLRREKWIRLVQKLGTSDEEIERVEPKEHTRNFIADLSEVYSTSEWQMAVGAMAALDKSFTAIRKALAVLLKNNFQLSDKDVEILNEETKSAHILDKVVFDHEAKDLVWQGVARQLEITKDFLIGLEKYIE